MRGRRNAIVAVYTGILLWFGVTAAVAMEPSDLPPSDDQAPVLTLVDNGNSHQLSLAEIERLDLYEAELEHFEGLTGVFTGVRLNAFIDEYGLGDARRLRFIGADDYTIFLELEYAREHGFLLVTRFNGEPVPRTELGPLMLVVPSEAEAVLAGEITPTNWIWSVIEIEAQ